MFTRPVSLSPPADDQFDESEDLSSVRHQTFLYTHEQKQGHIGINIIITVDFNNRQTLLTDDEVKKYFEEFYATIQILYLLRFYAN